MHLEILKLEEKYGFCFLRLKDCKKGTADAFSNYKLTSKRFLLYLEVKLQQGRCGWCVYGLKCLKNVFNKVFPGKQLTSRCHCCFYMLKCLKKGTTNVFRPCKLTSKVRLMFLDVKKLKISCKYGSKILKSKNQSTTDFFRG